ncbi:short-chain dehydrogenase [Seiridium cupressi]
MTPKSVLITGCSDGGIGSSFARAFQQVGYRVFAAVRDITKAKQLESVENIQLITLDVTSSKAIASCVGEVEKELDGRLDILVNNAGGAIFGPLAHASITDSKALYDINVWGALSVTQAFLPFLIRAKGVIVNISSMAGAVPLAWQGIYNSSKAALTFLSETLKMELEPLGVRVVTAMVGAVNTQIYSNSTLLMPEDSWYAPIESIIRDQAEGKLQEPNNEAVEITTGNIVRDVLRGCRGQIWRGGEAGAASVGSWMLPTRVREFLLHRNRGLSLLRRVYKKKGF